MDFERNMLIDIVDELKEKIETSFMEYIEVFKFEFLYYSSYIHSINDFFNFLKNDIRIFFDFLKTRDLQSVDVQGKLAALQGIDTDLLFLFFNLIDEFLFSWFNDEKFKILTKVRNIYKNIYIKSFIKEHDRQKDSQHEQLSNSINETLKKQKEKIIENQKTEVEKRKKFLINFAHDTMTPLTVLKNQINIYRETREEETFLSVEKSVDQVIDMINNFLDYEKIEKGEMLYNHIDIINLSNFLSSKIVLFKDYNREKNIKFYANIKESLFVKINPHALSRIINNVFNNAIKYNKPDGKIEIVLTENDESVIFSIHDTGIGMTKKQLDLLFTPYFNRERDPNYPGMGEGLAGIKNLLDEIQAKIEITSKENKGTSVKITFQKILEIDKSKGLIRNMEQFVKSIPISQERKEIPACTYNKLKYTILVVEDDYDIVKLLYIKTNDMFNFYYAFDGEDALKMISNGLIPTPNIIISDIMMKKMNGYVLYDKIKGKIPFIFITAKRDETDKIECYKKGIVEYVQKPFDINELMYKTQALLFTIEQQNKREYYDYWMKKQDQILRDRDKDEFTCFDETCKKYNLTEQERRIVKLYLNGDEQKDIAADLNISIHTVRRHIASVFQKCGIENRQELNTMFRFYEKQIKSVLDTDFKNDELIVSVLSKDWRK